MEGEFYLIFWLSTYFINLSLFVQSLRISLYKSLNFFYFILLSSFHSFLWKSYLYIFCIYRTVIGLRGKDGIVFAVEKIVTSKLYEAGTNKRIFNIDQHVGMAVSGLISDARQIVEIARSEASSYKSQYGIGIPLKYLNERVSMYMHAYTLYSAVRPYGCSVILGAYEHDGPAMYMIDPSGVSYGYYGCAVGEY